MLQYVRLSMFWYRFLIVELMFVSAGQAQTTILFETQNESQQDRQSQLFNYLEGIWRRKLVYVTSALIENLVLCACSVLPGVHRITSNLGWR